jgi:hypothetical protein
VIGWERGFVAQMVSWVRGRERKASVALETLRRFDPAALYHCKKEFRALADVKHPQSGRIDPRGFVRLRPGVRFAAQ